jgi:hypothetical protein
MIAALICPVNLKAAGHEGQIRPCRVDTNHNWAGMRRQSTPALSDRNLASVDLGLISAD